MSYFGGCMVVLYGGYVFCYALQCIILLLLFIVIILLLLCIVMYCILWWLCIVLCGSFVWLRWFCRVVGCPDERMKLGESKF